MGINKSKKKSTDKSKKILNGKLKEALGILIVLVAAFGIICGILYIPSCKEEAPHEGIMEKEWKRVTDTETGIVYVECPEGYGATGINVDSVFMECEDGKGTLKFYEMRDTDTAEYLALKEVNGYTVYRAESVTAPSIKSFTSGTAKLFMKGSNAPIDQFYRTEAVDGDPELDGTEYINMIVDALSGEGADGPTGAWAPNNNYSIWLSSKEYPGLYYKVDFKVDINGAEWLYDRVTEKLVRAPKALVARIMV